jgi:2-oxo-4-hydroxy-4-carboxy-5-ureidoimidazoline decarboxylase
VTGGLAEFNRAGDTELQHSLSSCCAAQSWVARVIAGRPYEDDEELFGVSDDATSDLDEAGLEQALGGHPRIGERGPGHGTDARAGSWSRQEQSGVVGADAELLAQLATANGAYEQRFGHVYLVCASGRSAAELLEVCRARLENDPATERGVVLDELAKINRLRLFKLLSQEVSP